MIQRGLACPLHKDDSQIYEAFHKYIYIQCKTQNSGLRSKEEKPRDPINQPSRCNAQEGLLTVAQTGDSDLLGGRAHRTANWASFLQTKKHTISISHMGYKVIGYMFAKQSYWYKLRGLLFKLKAILLVQTARAFYWGWGIPPFHGKPKPKSRPPASPSPGSPV